MLRTSLTVLRTYLTPADLSDGTADQSDGCGLVGRLRTYLTVLRTYLTVLRTYLTDVDLSDCAADLSDGFGLI